MTRDTATVGIVGGGLAGLAAAAALSEHGIRVELFEARRQLGGRAGSFRDPASGELVDHCQHVGMGCCTNLLHFCRRTGIEDCFDRYSTLHFFGPDGRRYDLSGTRWLPAPLHLGPALMRLGYLTVRERLGIALGLMRLARSRTNDVREEGNANDTIGQWLRSAGQSEQAIQRFWGTVLVSALGESIDRASRSAARKVFVDGFMAARAAYHVYVPRVPLSELYSRHIARSLSDAGVRIHLGTPITRLLGNVSRVYGVALDDGIERTFDWVVLAVPWHRVRALSNAAIDQAVPQLKTAEEIQSAPITGIHLWFDRPVMTLPHAVLIDRLSQWVFARGEHSPVEGREPEYYVQVVISASHDLAERKRDDVLAEVLSDLCAIWPQAATAVLLRWRMVTEHDAVFSIQPHVDNLRPAQHTSVPGLLLGGDWTQTGWPATMEGAVLSGYLAAEAILHEVGIDATYVQPPLRRTWLARWMLGES